MEDSIRFLLLIAFVGLLLLLRFDAFRFGTAEYDDEHARGGLRGWFRRLAWYGMGAALVVAIFLVHPLPISELRLDPGDDRQEAIGLGLAFGVGGTLVAFMLAWYRYRRFRLPPARQYPGAIVNCIGTSFLDEALFRGVILGLTLAADWPLVLAIAFQAVLYGLATRLGAPGRSRAMLFISIGVGAIGGYLTVETGGIAAAFVGHAITRFAIFMATGHAGQVRPRGYEPEEELGHSLPPEGWEIVVDPDIAPDVPANPGRLRHVPPG